MGPRLKTSHKGGTWEAVLSSAKVKCWVGCNDNKGRQEGKGVGRQGRREAGREAAPAAARPCGRHCHLLAR